MSLDRKEQPCEAAATRASRCCVTLTSRLRNVDVTAGAGRSRRVAGDEQQGVQATPSIIELRRHVKNAHVPMVPLGSTDAFRPRNPYTSLAHDELGDDGDGLLRLFFHYPMAGVGDDGSLDITGDKFHFRLHRRSIRMVPADREDGHAKLPDLRKQCSVLLGVSSKRGKLTAKRIVNSPGPRIQLGVVASRVLIKRCRLRRHLVVEAIE